MNIANNPEIIRGDIKWYQITIITNPSGLIWNGKVSMFAMVVQGDIVADNLQGHTVCHYVMWQTKQMCINDIR